MVTANDKRSKPPARAIHCNCHPMSKPKATKNSPKVAAQARAGMAGSGANQLSFATYATNGCQAPQATFGAPGGPHTPKRSASAERKPAARARRRNHCAASTIFALFILGLGRTTPPHGEPLHAHGCFMGRN